MDSESPENMEKTGKNNFPCSKMSGLNREPECFCTQGENAEFFFEIGFMTSDPDFFPFDLSTSGQLTVSDPLTLDREIQSRVEFTVSLTHFMFHVYQFLCPCFQSALFVNKVCSTITMTRFFSRPCELIACTVNISPFQTLALYLNVYKGNL